MLIRFKVANYLSFDEPQTFTTYSGRPRLKKDHLLACGKQNLLKFSAIYGANASGKSNLIDAMALSQHIILHGLPSGIANNYFRLKVDNKTKPTTFEYEIEINGRIYAYGFDIILSENKIVGEWLWQLHPQSTEERIYERQPSSPNESDRVIIGEKYQKTDLKVFAEGMSTNTVTLFLQDINFGKLDLFKKYEILSPISEVFGWFGRKLIINRAGASLFPRIPGSLIRTDAQFEEVLVNNIIPYLGIGIRNVVVQKEDPRDLPRYLPKESIEQLINECKKQVDFITHETGTLPGELELSALVKKDYIQITLNPGTFEIIGLKRLTFIHEENPNGSTLFTYGEESDGTRAILNLIDILSSATNALDYTYIVDELDRYLHPLLSHKFVELFFKLSKGKTQLITATHETHLMDLDLLRQDEIWLISKQSTGASILYSLDEYNVRYDKKLSKAYLNGVYGGIPLIESTADTCIDLKKKGKE